MPRKLLKVKGRKIMDINEIKKLIREEKAKVIIADEQGRTLVIMDYAEYRAIKAGNSAEPIEQPSLLPKYKPEAQREEPKSSPDEEALKIEDLPF